MGIYDEIATALTGLRGQQAEQALRLVERAMAGDALTETQARIIARALTTPAALAAYATATSELEPEQ
jgi:Mg/Co/Ni transporter MgtE